MDKGMKYGVRLLVNALTDSEVAILFISPWRTLIMRANGLEGSPGLLN